MRPAGLPVLPEHLAHGRTHHGGGQYLIMGERALPGFALQLRGGEGEQLAQLVLILRGTVSAIADILIGKRYLNALVGGATRQTPAPAAIVREGTVGGAVELAVGDSQQRLADAQKIRQTSADGFLALLQEVSFLGE